MATTTVLPMELDEALANVDAGALFVDLRPAPAYLGVHIPGSIPLVYERGPGMAGRARDCLPLEIPLVLLDPGNVDIGNAAAALRGKGFAVLGAVKGALEGWGRLRGVPASTEIAEGDEPPTGALLDVGDPGARVFDHSVHIPVESLWDRLDDLPKQRPLVVNAGYAVRAALAIGILEHAGAEDLVLYKPAGTA
jgi:rhodanese-related sulfurtransferase